MSLFPHIKSSMIEWVKSLNKNDISYDEQGRMVIRVAPTDKNLEENVVESKQITRQLTNKLLHPTDRVIHQSLAVWTKQLLGKFQLTLALTEERLRIEKLAEIYNNAALIFFSMGDVKRARELCYSQIHLFIKKFSQYTFQPWINLSRIDRVLGSHEDALKKLRSLEDVDYAMFTKEDSQIAAVVKTCSLLEPIKIYLQINQYQKVVDIYNKIQKATLTQNDSFLYEAVAVAFSRLDQADKAMELLRFAKSVVSPVVMPVFMLRECELDTESPLLNKLYTHTLSQLKTNTSNGNAIIFAHHLVEVMQETRSSHLAIKLSYESFAAANKLGDEVLKAESLSKLYHLMVDEHDQNHIEKLMIDLYSQTQYVSVKKKLLNSCSSLSKIKTNVDCVGMDELYQKLMLYANSKNI